MKIRKFAQSLSVCLHAKRYEKTENLTTMFKPVINENNRV